MSYVALTPELFLTNLKGGKYSEITGARRAIGKASWSETDKAKCRTQADKFFGTTDEKKEPKVPGKRGRPRKDATAAVAAPEPKKAAKAPRATKAAAEEPAVKVKSAVTAEKQLELFEKKKAIAKSADLTEVATVQDICNNPYKRLQVAHEGIAQANDILHTLSELKKSAPETSISEVVDEAKMLIQTALAVTTSVISAVVAQSSTDEAKHASNGAHGSALYEAPSVGENPAETVLEN